MDCGRGETVGMNTNTVYLYNKFDEIDSSEQIIIIDSNEDSTRIEDSSYNATGGENTGNLSGWSYPENSDVRYIESALSSDSCSPVKNNRVIIIDSNNDSTRIQASCSNVAEGEANRNLGSWQYSENTDVEYVGSALSSNDESSPNKNNNDKEPVQGTSRTVQEELQNKPTKKVMKKNYGRVKIGDQISNVENSAIEVRKRFELGCECTESCFRGLNPEAVYRHRLNIAELTKEEHDMYLMGVTMACMSDPVSTNKRRERRRARPNYAYSGRRVCLSAFLYLENVTLYQLKRIRKHVMSQGVTPRIHGNHGKKPHNVFPLDIYRRATTFLKDFIQLNNTSGNSKGPIILPPNVTRKSVHKEYKEYMYCLFSSDEKILGYSTFRHFMKEQFPNLRFSKSETVPYAGHSKNYVKLSTKVCQVCDASESEVVHQCGGVLHRDDVSTNNMDVSQISVIITEQGGLLNEPR